MQLEEEIIEIDSNRYPTLLKRIQSIFIDSMIILISMLILTALLSNIEGTPDWVRGALFLGLFGVHEPLLISLGRDIGKSFNENRSQTKI